MTSGDLSAAYVNMALIPGGAAYPARWAAAAAAFRVGAQGATIGQPVGSSPRHVLDVYSPAGSSGGTLVFVHGGYWRAFAPSDFSHLAAGALAQGWAVAMPGYDLCPAVRVRDITRQVAEAVTAVAERSAGPIVLCGHSAGGHLVARLLAPGLLPDAVVARIVRVVPISPVSDLRPLLRTDINADLRLDAAEAEAESPVLKPGPSVPVHVWVGAAERPAFLDQARWLAEAWDCPLTVEPERHHFDVIEGLERQSPLLSACLGPV